MHAVEQAFVEVGGVLLVHVHVGAVAGPVIGVIGAFIGAARAIALPGEVGRVLVGVLEVPGVHVEERRQDVVAPGVRGVAGLRQGVLCGVEQCHFHPHQVVTVGSDRDIDDAGRGVGEIEVVEQDGGVVGLRVRQHAKGVDGVALP